MAREFASLHIKPVAYCHVASTMAINAFYLNSEVMQLELIGTQVGLVTHLKAVL